MLQFNYHHLYYFKVIATEGSISKAAAKLRLGQPTVSMQLKQFEDYLGFPLFERKNRSLILTEMGRMILSYANEIFRLGDEMMDTIKDRPVQRRQRLQIGALDSIPKSLIRDLMAKAYEKYDCHITVLEGGADELVTQLLEHRLDLLLSNTHPPSRVDKKLYSKSIARMPIIVVGSDKYLPLKNQFPKSLNKMPFIMPTSHSRLRHDLENYFSDKHIHVDLVAEAQDTSLLKILAIEGQGLMALPEPAVRNDVHSKHLHKIGQLEGLVEEIWLVATQRRIQNPIAEVLMKEFQL